MIYPSIPLMLIHVIDDVFQMPAWAHWHEACKTLQDPRIADTQLSIEAIPLITSTGYHTLSTIRSICWALGCTPMGAILASCSELATGLYESICTPPHSYTQDNMKCHMQFCSHVMLGLYTDNIYTENSITHEVQFIYIRRNYVTNTSTLSMNTSAKQVPLWYVNKLGCKMHKDYIRLMFVVDLQYTYYNAGILRMSLFIVSYTSYINHCVYFSTFQYQECSYPRANRRVQQDARSDYHGPSPVATLYPSTVGSRNMTISWCTRLVCRVVLGGELQPPCCDPAIGVVRYRYDIFHAFIIVNMICILYMRYTRFYAFKPAYMLYILCTKLYRWPSKWKVRYSELDEPTYRSMIMFHHNRIPSIPGCSHHVRKVVDSLMYVYMCIPIWYQTKHKQVTDLNFFLNGHRFIYMIMILIKVMIDICLLILQLSCTCIKNQPSSGIKVLRYSIPVTPIGYWTN